MTVVHETEMLVFRYAQNEFVGWPERVCPVRPHYFCHRFKCSYYMYLQGYDLQESIIRHRVQTREIYLLYVWHTAVWLDQKYSLDWSAYGQLKNTRNKKFMVNFLFRFVCMRQCRYCTYIIFILRYAVVRKNMNGINYKLNILVRGCIV